MRRPMFALAASLAALACSAHAVQTAPPAEPRPKPAAQLAPPAPAPPAPEWVSPPNSTGDPTTEEVALPAAPGWLNTLVHDNGKVGIWTVGTLKAFPLYGCPEIFGLDDKGHCWIYFSYSGKWTPMATVEDGEWLGALQQLDLDPRLPGAEIYTGGKKGNLFQIRPLREGGFDTKVIARMPAQEIHTIVAGELLPSRPGAEMLVFTLRGEIYDVAPEAGGAEFRATQIANLETRVRQAELLPAAPGEAPWMIAACRAGEVTLLRMTADGLEHRAIVHEPMGFGRLALARTEPGQPCVVYASRDDGIILRLQGRPGDANWAREVIYAGPEGPRGVAAGRFDADPEVETVAVFGYSRRVQLLSRRPGQPWTAQTLFEERDKGHWLATAELDGRNATDELIGSGYGGRVFLLSREPGYGLPGIPTDPDAEARPVLVPAEGTR